MSNPPKLKPCKRCEELSENEFCSAECKYTYSYKGVTAIKIEVRQAPKIEGDTDGR